MRRALLCLVGLVTACGGPAEPVTSNPGDAAIDSATDSATDAEIVDTAPDAVPDSSTPSKLRVLFIGNSYTYTNDIPGMLTRIAATAGAPPTIETAQVVVGGATLQMHWQTGDAQKRIDEKTWTHVVLQGQSLEPLFQPETFRKYAIQFADLIVTTPARPTFYATWARAAGDASYAETWSGGTPDAMQDRLSKAYGDVAARTTTNVLVKVGEAFRSSLKGRPGLALHVADKSHPTVAGSYLSACTFYVALTGHAVPPASEVPTGISSDDASFLRSTAAGTATAP